MADDTTYGPPITASDNAQARFDAALYELNNILADADSWWNIPRIVAVKKVKDLRDAIAGLLPQATSQASRIEVAAKMEDLRDRAKSFFLDANGNQKSIVADAVFGGIGDAGDAAAKAAKAIPEAADTIVLYAKIGLVIVVGVGVYVVVKRYGHAA